MGIILILLGIMCGCMTALMPMAMLAPHRTARTAPRVRDFVGGLMVYGFIAVLFIWSGIGSIQRRRWVRPVVLVFSWMWLIVGVVTMIAISFTIGDMQHAIAAQATTAPAMPQLPGLIYAFMIFFMLMCYVVLPGILILCYKGVAVQATLEFYDPNPRWTDGRPIPALAFSAILAMGVLGILFALVSGIFPLFGLLLTGGLARLCLLVAAVLYALAARWSYLLRLAGWKLGLGLILLLGCSGIVTFLHIPLMEIYRAMGTPPDQLDMISKMHALTSGWMVSWLATATALAVGYAIYVRRYFHTGPGFVS